MDQIRQYILSVAAAALVVSILMSLSDEKNTSGVILRLMGGLFLVFTVIAPLVEPGIGDLSSYFAAFSHNGEDAATRGEILARDSYCSYIKTETEAYILDKAEAYGADLAVEVTLLDSGVPGSVRLTGSVSPYAKRCLQTILAQDLGISKENQSWSG